MSTSSICLFVCRLGSGILPRQSITHSLMCPIFLPPCPENTGQHAAKIGNTTHMSVLCACITHCPAQGSATSPSIPPKSRSGCPLKCLFTSTLASHAGPKLHFFLAAPSRSPLWPNNSQNLRTGCEIVHSMHPLGEDTGRRTPREEGNPSASLSVQHSLSMCAQYPIQGWIAGREEARSFSEPVSLHAENAMMLKNAYAMWWWPRKRVWPGASW